MKQIHIVGIGMGNEKTLTIEARDTIQKAEVLIGAKRMVESCNKGNLPVFYSYDKKEIKQFIRESDYSSYVILMSGDTGFYSGTKELKEALHQWKVSILPGISSVSYFFAKIGLPWQDANLLSAHGRECDIVAAVRQYKKTFILTSNNIASLCEQLIEAGFGELPMFIGERLSYEQEQIHKGSVATLAKGIYDKLSVIVVLNPNARKRLMTGIDDMEFARGKVPMTKSEVRAVIMSKLRLEEQSVVYDIGAGTGSVSVEIAHFARKVYAIEKKEEAIELIEENKKRFGLNNIEVIHGVAPEAMDGLQMPTSVFIGGSGGNLRDIIAELCKRTKSLQIVVSAIALETLQEAIAAMQEEKLTNMEISQVTIAKASVVGKYHMMMGQNPIYIVSGRKE